MKIHPTRPSKSVRKLKTKTEPVGAGFSPVLQAKERAAPAVMTSSPIASVDALIALQAEGGAQSATQKAAKRAYSLLGILDTIRLGLLEGGIPQPTLKRLLNALGEQRQGTGDPALEAILEQVEIRAQVELAKLESSELH